MSNEKIKGSVRWFSNDRGFGFIVIDGATDGMEYFVHYTSIVMEGYKTLQPGAAVLFNLKDTEKGIQAVDVEPA